MQQDQLTTPLLSSRQAARNLGALMREIGATFFPLMLSDLGIDVSNTVNAYLFSHISPEENYSAGANLTYTEQIVLVVVPATFLYMLPVILYPKPKRSSIIVTNALLFSFATGLISAVIFIFSED